MYQGQAQSNEAFLAAANLAALLTKPFSFLHSDHLEIKGISKDDLVTLSLNASFQKPLNTLIKKQFAIDEIKIPASLFIKVKSDDKLKRMAAVLTTMKGEELQALANHIAATILHRKILECVVKQERQAVIKQLGEAAFNTAIREAAVFYPDLGKLDKKHSLKKFLSSDADDSETQAGDTFVHLGYRTILNIVNEIEPVLGKLLELRLPKNPAVENETPSKFSKIQTQQFTKLFYKKAGRQ